MIGRLLALHIWLKKNPVQYKFYVTGCGRYARLDQLWSKLRK